MHTTKGRKLDPKLEVACYMHKDDILCAIVPSELLSAGIELVSALFQILHEIETKVHFKDSVRKAFPIDAETEPTEGYFRDYYSKQIAEVMRMSLVMENYGEQLQNNMDKTCMTNHFFDRMDPGDQYNICLHWSGKIGVRHCWEIALFESSNCRAPSDLLSVAMVTYPRDTCAFPRVPVRLQKHVYELIKVASDTLAKLHLYVPSAELLQISEWMGTFSNNKITKVVLGKGPLHFQEI